MFNILGSFGYPSPIRLCQQNHKSYLFLRDHWKEVGDIEYFYMPESAKTGSVYMKIPDAGSFALEHEDEGAVSWLEWGPRVN